MSAHVSTRVTPVRGTPMKRYAVLLNGIEIYGQLSALSVQDVASAVARHQELQRQARIVKQAAAPKPAEFAKCRTCKAVLPVNAFALDVSVRAGHKRDCRNCLRTKRLEKRA